MTQEEINERVNDLKRQKEGIKNVIANLALMPDEIKTYTDALIEIDRELLCYKMIKNYY